MSREPSSDVKQFFRFVVSGYVCLTYYFGFLLASSNALHTRMQSISPVSLGLLATAVSSLVFSIPLGFLIHELHISLQSPYRESRFRRKRKCFTVLRGLQHNGEPRKTDEELQALLEFAKYAGDDHEAPLNAHLEKELSNRYSYYYGRIDAAIFAPVFAFALFLVSGFFGWFGIEISWTDVVPIIIIVIVITIISIPLAWYALKLLDEIDAIETLIIKKGKHKLEDLISNNPDKNRAMDPLTPEQ